MSLFQKVIVKKYLKNLPSDLIEKNYKKYSEHFNDFAMADRVKALKEEQYQEGFLRDLFVKCLGYTINPYENFNLTTEFKNKTDAEKADGAILKNGNPIAVIELKSTKTKDLRTIEKQAFNYKTHQSNCKYVITSNFEKIRLYINDATEFEEFNVFQLSRNEFEFLYLCFSKDSIFEDIPSIIKEKSNQHEEQISKKLYNDYSNFRNKIFQNLTKNNPQIDKLILFKKSQKLLDRFLFIFFAEDKGLIPANMISIIIDEYNKLKEMDHYTPLFSEFKRFFGYINKGNPKYNIDEYNGGLFQFDEILDNVKIDDEILINDSLKLSNYDFDSEVDVNILGHIFEHSLTDIEKLNAEILIAKGHVPLLKKQTRRKKEGVFYTPNYITKYIVENTIGTLCNEKKDEFKLNNIEIDETYFKKTKNVLSQKGEQLFDKLENYKEWLLSLKILDPACGSGAFLNQTLNFLIDEHNFIINLETDLRKGQLSLFDIDTAVLENNLYGVDINEESIEIAKLSLWLKTAKRGRKLTDLSKHIKCGNSLIDDPEIAGEKAFDWNKEFPEVFYIKEKRTWHITTATHNSRYSQRMLDNHVKLGEPVWLAENDEINITETIAEIIEKDNLNIPAYNICGDHLHMILVCEEDEMPKIVGKIKAVSARKHNIEKGITVPAATRGYVPLSTAGTTEESAPELSATRGHVLPEKDEILSPEISGTREHVPLSAPKSAKKKYNQLWTQKFGRKEIVTDEQLNNTLNYIRNNRKKHKLPENKKLNAIIEKMTCTIDHAYRFEYKGGFDVVIGNPPYVSKTFTEQEKSFYNNNYKTAQYQLDLYVSFMEQGTKILKPSGVLSYIVPNSWLKNLMFDKCRSFILNNMQIETIIPNLDNVFTDASVDTLIFVGTKSNNLNSAIKIGFFKQNNYYDKHMVDQQRFFNNDKLIFDVEISKTSESIFEKIEKLSSNLSNVSKVTRGINPYDKYRGQSEEIIRNKIYHSNYKKDGTFVPEIRGKHVNRYSLEWDGRSFVSYGEWLAAPRDPIFFRGNRIICRQVLGKNLNCTFLDSDFIIDQSVFIAKFDNIQSVKSNPKFILSQLTSKLVGYYFRYKANEFDALFPKIKIGEYKQLPVKIISKNNQQPFIERADTMLSLNKQKHEQINRFLHRVEVNFSTDKRANKDILSVDMGTNVENYSVDKGTCPFVRKTKKLSSFYNYDFTTFVSELKKQKIKLTLSQQDEWEEYFNNFKEEINELQKQIDKTDNEIDQMVYELYGLTKEEIEIVEKG